MSNYTLSFYLGATADQDEDDIFTALFSGGEDQAQDVLAFDGERLADGSVRMTIKFYATSVVAARLYAQDLLAAARREFSFANAALLDGVRVL